jgi:hypothetical protein
MPRITPVRIAIVVATIVFLGVAVLEMSGAAPRISETNGVNPAGFYASVKRGQTLCQPDQTLPADAARVRFLIGTYGRPLPRISGTFVATSGRVVAHGVIPAGGSEGYVTLPLRHSEATTGKLCLRVSSKQTVVIAGWQTTASPADQTLNGKRQPASLSLTFLRAGNESWWRLLPTVFRRFGYGKWSVLGSWTFIACGVALVLVWVASLRLLWRELS